MIVVPERFEMPASQKYAAAGLAAVMLGIAAVGGWFAVNGNPGSTDPRGDHVAFLAMAALFGLIAVIIAAEARRVWRSAITLRDGGLEVEQGDGTPNFMGWGQIAGLKLQSARGGIGVNGLDGERLLAVDTRLPGVGRLLYAILANAVLPKRSPILPYTAAPSTPRAFPVAIALVVGLGLVSVVVGVPAEVRLAVAASVVAIGMLVAGVTALATRLGGASAVLVDAAGITIGRDGMRRPWNTVQGAALAFVRGPKGQLFPRVALQDADGRWEPLALQGADLVELLAAINAAAPGKVIAPPDQPIALRQRLFAKRIVGGR